MKLLILLALFMSGTVRYDVFALESSGIGAIFDDENVVTVFGDDEGDDEDNVDDEDEDNEGNVEHGSDEDDEDDEDNEGRVEYGSDEDDEDEEEEYDVDCDHFNLEICMYDYGNYENFDAPDSDDPLCWEAYTTMQCLHDYAKDCFADSEMKEDYLCKIRYAQDRIQLLCLNETEELDEDEEAIQQALECLEGTEVIVEECVEVSAPKIRDMVKARSAPTPTGLDDMKCMLLGEVMECTTDRLKERCDEEIVDAFKEGIEEGLEEVWGGMCKDRTITGVISEK